MACDSRGSKRRSADAKENLEADDEIIWIEDIPAAVLSLITLTHRFPLLSFNLLNYFSYCCFRTLKARARKLSKGGDVITYIMLENDSAVNLVWFAGSLPGHLLEVLIAEKAPTDAQRALPRSLSAKGGRWIAYVNACVWLVQGLHQFDKDHAAVSQALTDSGRENGVKLLVDVLLFSFSIGMATAKAIEFGAEAHAVSDCDEMCDVAASRDSIETGAADSKSEGQAETEELPEDGDASSGKFSTLSSPVDLVGACVRAIAGFLRDQLKQSEIRGKKYKGAVEKSATAGTVDFQSTLTGHHLVGRALVESIFDAMELFFSAIDDATGQRRKGLILYVAGTIEILYVCRCARGSWPPLSSPRTP